MCDDSLDLAGCCFCRQLFENDAEIFERTGLFIESFSAGSFHELIGMGLGKPHNPHTGPVCLNGIHGFQGCV